MTALNQDDLRHLRRCIELAREALQAGDEPFGSVLVDAEGNVRAEDRNRTAGGDQTRHPEFELARWSSTNLTPPERQGATVYTSGEHCAMCSAAHAWVGLGRIVYVASTEQLLAWRRDLGLTDPSPVNPLPVNAVAPGVVVGGPALELEEEIRELHRRHAESSAQDPIA
jgi:tRNA(Arg) A34 adenosine deaminase TadA